MLYYQGYGNRQYVPFLIKTCNCAFNQSCKQSYTQKETYAVNVS